MGNAEKENMGVLLRVPQRIRTDIITHVLYIMLSYNVIHIVLPFNNIYTDIICYLCIYPKRFIIRNRFTHLWRLGGPKSPVWAGRSRFRKTNGAGPVRRQLAGEFASAQGGHSLVPFALQVIG